MTLGSVRWFDSQQGHGVIRLDTRGDVYITTSVLDEIRSGIPEQGQRVECAVVAGPMGRSLEHVRLVASLSAGARRSGGNGRSHCPPGVAARNEAEMWRLRDEVLA